jgi:hypothetical protein
VQCIATRRPPIEKKMKDAHLQVSVSKGELFPKEEGNTMGFLVKCAPKQQRYVDGEVAPVLYVGVQALQDSTPERKRV